MLAYMRHQSCTYRCCGDCTVQQSRQAATVWPGGA